MKKPRSLVVMYYNFFVYHLSVSLKGHCHWGGGGGGGEGGPCACGYVCVSFSLLRQHFGLKGLHFV